MSHGAANLSGWHCEASGIFKLKWIPREKYIRSLINHSAEVTSSEDARRRWNIEFNRLIKDDKWRCYWNLETDDEWLLLYWYDGPAVDC